VGAVGGWYDVSPDCIEHGLEGGLVASAEVQAPFLKCFEESGGFFTFGPGTNWDAEGNVIQSASAGLWIITVIGIIVMILAFAAWVWFEHSKLTAQAARLRAAATPGPGPPPASPAASTE
jgi:hypothetical protein